jgi:acyl dehydratase
MIGKSTKPRQVEIDKSQIRRFALAIGEDNPIHFDEAAAKASGYPAIVGPPTFASALIDSLAFFEELGLDPVSIMHRAEEYEYYRPLCAGDSLNIVHRVADIYDKDTPTGAILFIIIETRGNDLKDKPVFKGRRTLVKLRS